MLHFKSKFVVDFKSAVVYASKCFHKFYNLTSENIVVNGDQTSSELLLVFSWQYYNQYFILRKCY